MRLTTRGPRVAQAIANREPFTTSGALRGTTYNHEGSGRLQGPDLEAWYADVNGIVYVVYSYATPIAWVTEDGRVHKVAQRFSVTTSKHQGTLYML